MKRNRTILALTALALLVLLTACTSVDKSSFQAIQGDYQAVGIYDETNDEYTDNWWHLAILQKDGGYHLSIYDNAAGNPGVEGKIVSLDASNIKIKIDQDLYDELPSDDWADSGKYLELTYEKTDTGITLTNNGASLDFQTDSK